MRAVEEERRQEGGHTTTTDQERRGEREGRAGERKGYGWQIKLSENARGEIAYKTVVLYGISPGPPGVLYEDRWGHKPWTLQHTDKIIKRLYTLHPRSHRNTKQSRADDTKKVGVGHLLSTVSDPTRHGLRQSQSKTHVRIILTR